MTSVWRCWLADTGNLMTVLKAGGQPMETVRPRSLRLPVPRPAIHIHLPMPIWLMLGLLQGVLFLTIGGFLLNHWPQHLLPPGNPFSLYADLMPGQVAADLESRGFDCQEQIGQMPSPFVATSCSYRPTSGAFDHVEVTLNDDNSIRLTTFTVHPGGLNAGDLALLWGRPPIQFSAGDTMSLNWRQAVGNVVANAKGGQFSYFMPLYKVTFLHDTH
jgi:hypothetical protein